MGRQSEQSSGAIKPAAIASALGRISHDEKGLPKDFVFLEASSFYERYFQQTLADILQQNLKTAEWVAKPAVHRFLSYIYAAVEQCQSLLFLEYLGYCDRWYKVQVNPIMPDHLSIVHMDISEDVLACMHPGNRLSSPDAHSFVLDEKGHFLAFCHPDDLFLGYPIQELQHRKVFDFLRPTDIPELKSVLVHTSPASFCLELGCILSTKDIQGFSWQIECRSGLFFVQTHALGTVPLAQPQNPSDEALWFPHSPVPSQIWSMRNAHTYATANAAHLAFLGLPAKEVEGQSIQQVLRSENLKPLQDLYLQAFAQKSIVSAELWLVDARNEKRLIRVVCTPLAQTTGDELMIVVAGDVTALEVGRKSLERSQKLYQTLTAGFSDAILVLNPPDWTIRSGNPALVRIFGLQDEQELISHTLCDISPGIQPDGYESSEKASQMFDQALKLGWHFFEWSFKKPNGEIFPAQILLIRVDFEDQIMMQAIVHDLSEQKRMEEALQHHEEKFRLLVETSSDVFWQMDRNFRLTYISPADKRIRGFEAQEVVGSSLWSYLKPEGIALLRSENSRGLQSGHSGTKNATLRYELEMRCKDDAYIWADITVTPMRDVQGRFVGYHGVARDITSRKQSEARLQESEAFLQRVFDSSRIGIIIFDPKNYIIRNCNTTAVKLFGFSAIQEVIGQRPPDISPSRQYDGTSSIRIMRYWVDRALTEGSVVFEWLFQLPAGQEWDAEVHLISFESAGKKYLQASILDITERKKAEQALKNNEARLKLSLKVNHASLFENNFETGEVVSSPELYHFMGYSEDEMPSQMKELVTLTHPDDYPRVLQSLEMHIQGKTPFYEAEFRMRNRAGDWVWVEGRGQIIQHTADGKPLILLGLTREIAARKKTEAALQESTRKLNTMIENLQGVVFHCLNDDHWTMVFLSDGIETLCGYPKTDFLGNAVRSFELLILEEDRDMVRSAIGQALEQKQAYEVEYRIRAADQSLKWVWERGQGVYDDLQQLLGIDGFLTDISSLKHTEAALRESEASLARSQEIAHVGSFTIDLESGKAKWSDEVYRILDLEPGSCEAAYDSFLKYFHPEDAANADMAFKNAIDINATGFELEHRIVIPETQQIKYLYQRCIFECDSQGKNVRVIGVLQDITQRKLSELEVRRTEEKFRMIFEKSPLGVFQVNEQGTVVAFNDHFARIFGAERQQITGLNITELPDPNAHPALEQVLSGQVASFEGNYLSLISGQEIPVRLLFLPIFSPEGEVEGGLGLLEDRSAFIQKENLEKQIAVAREAVKFKQNFLANMSHEIRTPLTGIMGMIELLSKTALDMHQYEYLHILRGSSENLMEIINQVLDFSKIEAGKAQLRKEPFRFLELLEHSEKFFYSICNKEIRMEWQTDKIIPECIVADKNRLIQVMNNLIGNAVKFSEKGNIRISAKREETLQSEPYEHPANLKIRIMVEDQGIGITVEKQKGLFVPFTQVDEADTRAYEGTGLGLAICKQLVEMHGGEIGLESEPGKGSRFWFTFETEEGDPVSDVLTNPQSKDTTTKGLQILLAEDKFVNQKVISLMLQTLGHVVTVAANGEQALQLYEPGSFDLILMDIQMPVMNGVEATRRLRQQYSHLPPIVGLSANAFEGDKEKYMGLGMDDYLTKPLRIEDFRIMANRWFGPNGTYTKQ